MELNYLDGKGQCGGTIGAVTYLNKANAIRESEYTSFEDTLKIMTWLGGELNRPPL